MKFLLEYEIDNHVVFKVKKQKNLKSYESLLCLKTLNPSFIQKAKYNRHKCNINETDVIKFSQNKQFYLQK